MKVLSLTTKYQRARYGRNKDNKHILLIGDAPSKDVETFLKEFYHNDHGTEEITVVILGNSFPDKEMEQILKNFTRKGRTKPIYLEGNPLNHKDLKGACAD